MPPMTEVTGGKWTLFDLYVGKVIKKLNIIAAYEVKTKQENNNLL